MSSEDIFEIADQIREVDPYGKELAPILIEEEALLARLAELQVKKRELEGLRHIYVMVETWRIARGLPTWEEAREDFNRVQDEIDAAPVEDSMIGPYTCKSCGHSYIIQWRCSRMRARQGKVDPNCPNCGAAPVEEPPDPSKLIPLEKLFPGAKVERGTPLFEIDQSTIEPLRTPVGTLFGGVPAPSDPLGPLEPLPGWLPEPLLQNPWGEFRMWPDPANPALVALREMAKIPFTPEETLRKLEDEPEAGRRWYAQYMGVPPEFPPTCKCGHYIDEHGMVPKQLRLQEGMMFCRGSKYRNEECNCTQFEENPHTRRARIRQRLLSARATFRKKQPIVENIELRVSPALWEEMRAWDQFEGPEKKAPMISEGPTGYRFAEIPVTVDPSVDFAEYREKA